MVGTRETLTINPGVAGNEQPLVSTREFWYSPDLLTNLAVTRKDPVEGLQVVRLRNVSRSVQSLSSSRFRAGLLSRMRARLYILSSDVAGWFARLNRSVRITP